jgi:ABC-type transport system involved in cytochrome c biogenesis permease subunit
MSRATLILSTFCFFLGFAYTMFALGRGRYHPSRFNFGVMLAGFVFQTIFLYGRGISVGRCPLTNLFEVLIFLSWSLVLIYLMVGTSYRLSLLGVFTSPLVFVFQIFAMLAPIDTASAIKAAHNPWLSMHAAVSMVAYGAFALSFVAGGMYLVQEKLLKTHRIGAFFYELPPIADLAVVINRLVLLGFVLLTAGLVAVAIGGSKPAGTGTPVQLLRAAWPAGVWLIYGGILAAKKWRQLSPRRMAMLALAAFALALSTLWGLNFISDKVHF